MVYQYTDQYSLSCQDKFERDEWEKERVFRGEAFEKNENVFLSFRYQFSLKISELKTFE